MPDSNFDILSLLMTYRGSPPPLGRTSIVRQAEVDISRNIRNPRGLAEVVQRLVSHSLVPGGAPDKRLTEILINASTSLVEAEAFRNPDPRQRHFGETALVGFAAAALSAPELHGYLQQHAMQKFFMHIELCPDSKHADRNALVKRLQNEAAVRHFIPEEKMAAQLLRNWGEAARRAALRVDEAPQTSSTSDRLVCRVEPHRQTRFFGQARRDRGTEIA